jgi:hypothetical protein
MPDLPPTSEIFSKRALAARHPTILTLSRIEWAIRKRRDNGLEKAGGCFETMAGEEMLHEPAFLAWFLGLSGRAKPRRLRRRAAASGRV